MGEATFAVGKILPPECDHLDCFRPASLEVSLVGSTVSHSEVCRFHKPWAKKYLVERHLEQEARRHPVCQDCGMRHAPGDKVACIEGHGEP